MQLRARPRGPAREQGVDGGGQGGPFTRGTSGIQGSSHPRTQRNPCWPPIPCFSERLGGLVSRKPRSLTYQLLVRQCIFTVVLWQNRGRTRPSCHVPGTHGSQIEAPPLGRLCPGSPGSPGTPHRWMTRLAPLAPGGEGSLPGLRRSGAGALLPQENRLGLRTVSTPFTEALLGFCLVQRCSDCCQSLTYGFACWGFLVILCWTPQLLLAPAVPQASAPWLCSCQGCCDKAQTRGLNERRVFALSPRGWNLRSRCRQAGLGPPEASLLDV